MKQSLYWLSLKLPSNHILEDTCEKQMQFPTWVYVGVSSLVLLFSVV